MTEGIKDMSENKTIFCTKCGSENDASAKFCSNCGVKLEAPVNGSTSENTAQSAGNVYAEGIYSGNSNASPYEKITDAEEIKPESVPVQEEIHINYGQASESNQNASAYSASGQQYYSASGQQYYSADGQQSGEGKGGYIGVSIASLICGILAIICCCATTFSLLLSIAAIVLGIITIVKKYDGKGMAIAGIATGGVAIVLTILAFVSLFASGAYVDFISELTDEFYY